MNVREAWRRSFAEHIRKTSASIDEIRVLLVKDSWSRVEITAMGAFLVDIYKGMEAVLRLFIEKAFDEKIKKNESWHKNLILFARERGLIPEGIDRTIDGMRQYRHLQMHGYSLDLDEKQLRRNAPEAIEAYGAFVDHLFRCFPEMKSKDDEANPLG